jgi:hypothetical protein
MHKVEKRTAEPSEIYAMTEEADTSVTLEFCSGTAPTRPGRYRNYNEYFVATLSPVEGILRGQYRLLSDPLQHIILLSSSHSSCTV